MRAQTTPMGRAKRVAMKRPFGVTLVGVLLLVQGLFLVVLASAAIFLKITLGGGLSGPLRAIEFTRLTVDDLLSGVVVGALGVFIALSGVGVLRLFSWAWLAAMALQGWTLALFLLDYFIGSRSSYGNYSGVFLSVIIVFYLNSRTVRHTFDLVRRRESTAAAVPPALTHAGTATEVEATSHSKEAS